MTVNFTDNFPSVHDIEIIKGKGPWDTKSGGELNVLFGLSHDTLHLKFLTYNQEELRGIPYDIRGLRAYTVEGLQRNKIGANEWHKLRNELVFTIKGVMSWRCEDLHGEVRKFKLKKGAGLLIPHHILHTYHVESDYAEILVVANTLFIPDNPATHDTYPQEAFHKLFKPLD